MEEVDHDDRNVVQWARVASQEAFFDHWPCFSGGQDGSARAHRERAKLLDYSSSGDAMFNFIARELSIDLSALKQRTGMTARPPRLVEVLVEILGNLSYDSRKR